MSLLGGATGDPNKTNRVRSYALVLATGSAVTLGVTLFVVAKPVCLLLGATQKMLPFSIAYLQLRAIGAPIERGTSVATSFCLAERDGTTPLTVTVIGLTVNIVMDALLCPRYGSTGVAIASVIASALGYVYLIRRLVKRKWWPSPLVWPEVGDIAPFLGFAGPVSLAVFLKILVFANMTTTSCALGTSAAAAHQIYITLFFLSAVALGNPFSWASQAFLPPLLAADTNDLHNESDGSQQPRQLKSVAAFKKIVSTSCVMAFSASILVVFFFRTMSRFCTNDPRVLFRLVDNVLSIVPFFTLYPVFLTLEGALYSVQRQDMALMLSLVFWFTSAVTLAAIRSYGQMSLGMLWIGSGTACGIATLTFGTVWRLLKTAPTWLRR